MWLICKSVVLLWRSPGCHNFMQVSVIVLVGVCSLVFLKKTNNNNNNNNKQSICICPISKMPIFIDEI